MNPALYIIDHKMQLEVKVQEWRNSSRLHLVHFLSFSPRSYMRAYIHFMCAFHFGRLAWHDANFGVNFHFVMVLRIPALCVDRGLRKSWFSPHMQVNSDRIISSTLKRFQPIEQSIRREDWPSNLQFHGPGNLATSSLLSFSKACFVLNEISLGHSHREIEDR
jgi:hypothetical protein